MPPKNTQSAPAALDRPRPARGSWRPSGRCPRCRGPCRPGGLGARRDLIGEALPVDLLVVQDVDLRAALVLLVGHLRRRLDVVGGHDAAVGALAGRVVLVRLALVGALGAGQADRRVGRRHLQDAGLVEDRQRDRGGARVELAEVGDRRLVLRGLAGVARGRARIPLARRRRGVVELLEGDRVVAGLPAGGVERHLLAVVDRDRLRAGVALQRQAGVDGDAGAARACARGAPGAAAAVVVVAAASGNSERQRGKQAARGCHMTYAQRVPSSRDRIRRERESKQTHRRCAMVTSPHHRMGMWLDHTDAPAVRRVRALALALGRQVLLEHLHRHGDDRSAARRAGSCRGPWRRAPTGRSTGRATRRWSRRVP